MVIYRNEDKREEEEQLDRIRIMIREMTEEERAIALEELGRIGLERVNESKYIPCHIN